MLQATIDLSTSGPSTGQKVVAFIVILFGLSYTVHRIIRSQYSGLPESLARRKADLRGARADADLTAVYLTANDAKQPGAIREAALKAINGNSDGPTMQTAASRLREELVRTWAPRWEHIPKSSRRIGSLAIAVFVFGAVAVSTEVLIGFLSTSSPGFNVGRWPVVALSETGAVIATAGDGVSSLPVISSIWSFVFAFAIILWESLYTHYYISGALLAAGAAAIALFEKKGKLQGTPRWIQSVPSPERVAKSGSIAVSGLWLLTLIGIGIGRTSGSHSLGVKYGLVMGGTGALVGMVYAGVVSYQRRHAFWDLIHDVTSASEDEQAYLLIRGVTICFAAAIGPLVPVYIAVALTKAPILIREFLAASIGMQLVVVFGGLAVLAAFLSEAKDAWGDVRQAFTISTARQQVRGTVVVGGVSIGVVAATYVLVSGLSKSILAGILAAIVAGLIAREGVRTLVRVQYRAKGLRSGGPTPAERIVIEGTPLEDRAGDREYYLRINGGTELLHPDQAGVVEACERVVEDLITIGEATPTVEEWHADWSFVGATGSFEETENKLVERSRKRTIVPLRKHGHRVPVEHLNDELGDIPDHIADVDPKSHDRLFRPATRKGILRVRDGYVELLNDVWA